MVDTKKAAKSRAKRIDLSSKQPGSSGYFPPLSNGLRSGRKPLDCPRRQRFAGLIVRFTPTHRRLACSAADAVPGWSGEHGWEEGRAIASSTQGISNTVTLSEIPRKACCWELA